MDEEREDWDDRERNDEVSDLVDRLRESYNPPPETPREEMWAAVEAALEGRAGAGARRAAQVVSLDARRFHRGPGSRWVAAWAVAAAALLILGIGIGRVSVRAPGRPAAVADVPDPTAMRLAAVEHLGQTESLLTLVRADARTGRLDPQVGPWARNLLAQTRLLLDAPEETDPTMRRMLEDLELVLVQIVGVTDTGTHDVARTRTELNLALKGLEDRDLMPRIQAMVPAGSGLSGTE
ncbi:MAG: hypothetical protein LJF06_00250 [Gemmatimonadetes bacterium]|nr:hypothetical protein [Gemmatimonadota bacterium]